MPIYTLTRDTAPSDLNGLAASHTATEEQVHLLRELVGGGARILITGAAHSGKSNLLRCLVSQAPSASTVAWLDHSEGELPHSTRRTATPQSYVPHLPGMLVVDAPHLAEHGVALRDVLAPPAEYSDWRRPALTVKPGGVCAIALTARSATGGLQRLAELVGGDDLSPERARALVAGGIDAVVVCGFRRTPAGPRLRQVVEVVSVAGVGGEQFITDVLIPPAPRWVPSLDELVDAHQREVAADLLEIIDVYIHNGRSIRGAFEVAAESEGLVGVLAEDILAHARPTRHLRDLFAAAPALRTPYIMALARATESSCEQPRLRPGVERLREQAAEERRGEHAGALNIRAVIEAREQGAAVS